MIKNQSKKWSVCVTKPATCFWLMVRLVFAENRNWPFQMYWWFCYRRVFVSYVLVLLFIYLLYFRPIILFGVTSRFCVDEWKKIESFPFHSTHRRISSFDYPSCGKVSFVANESRFFSMKWGYFAMSSQFSHLFDVWKKYYRLVSKEFNSTMAKRFTRSKDSFFLIIFILTIK